MTGLYSVISIVTLLNSSTFLCQKVLLITHQKEGTLLSYTREQLIKLYIEQ